jgi:hypothetical protein
MSKRAADRRIDQITGQAPELFVYLKPGYQYEGQHCFGEDTKADIRNTMKMVKPCACDECAALLKATP